MELSSCVLVRHFRARIERHWRRTWTAHPTCARLYVKDACELCDCAREILRPFVSSGHLRLEIVDIARDLDLGRRYGLSIPVLEIRGGPRLDWPFDSSDVRRALG